MVRSYVVADLSGNLVEVHRSEDTEPTFLSPVFEFIPLHILDQFGCAGSMVSAFDDVYCLSCSSLNSLKLTRLGLWESCVPYCTCIFKNRSYQLLVGLFSEVGRLDGIERRVYPSLLAAFPVMKSVISFHHKLDCNFTPRYVTVGTLDITVLCNV